MDFLPPLKRKMVLQSAVILLVIVLAETSFSSNSFHPFLRRHSISKHTRVLADDIYQTLYIRQPVDHFAFANQDTFLQRYIVVDKYWGGNGNPIFFYAGNEGDIFLFLNNTGLMFDWAPEFKAKLVFAEHRYYGNSMPYGADSYKDLKRLGYLSAEQALADFALLIDFIKTNVSGAKSSPVVAFGGSYGGMLAAWFRMKYPHSIVGALASSAPILQFGDLVPCDSYSRIATDDFRNSGPNCADNIRKSWKVLTKMGETVEGCKLLTQTFGLCKPLDPSGKGQEVKGWLVNTWSMLPMVDYPYAASFLEPLPAWPVKAVCAHLAKPDLTDLELIRALRDAVNVYYNYTGTTSCFNTSQEAVASLGDLGWSFQACSEMVMPSCSNGVTDMFEASPWDFDDFRVVCQQRWGVTPRPNWIQEQFGGRNITAASNIIFSNGKLDPWSGGGVQQSLSKTLVAIMIEDAAHHLDLRSSNPDDPQSVIRARALEKQIVKNWITNSRSGIEKTRKPNSEPDCAFEKLIIINSQLPDDSNHSVGPVVAVSWQQNILVFTILCTVFLIVMVLVGLRSHQRRHSKNQFFPGSEKNNMSLI